MIPMILHHHERYDGSGYPDGLTGCAIPIGARIVAIADAYQAMVHDRPHQKAISHGAALAELRRHAGSQFDPDLVAAFCELYTHEVPADGLEEVYQLYEHARGGRRQLRAHRLSRGSGEGAVGGENATDTMRVAAGEHQRPGSRSHQAPQDGRAQTRSWTWSGCALCG